MNLNAASRRFRTVPAKISVLWNEEMPVDLVVRHKQSLQRSMRPLANEEQSFEESEYDSLFRSTQARLDRVKLSIARISPFYGSYKCDPQEVRLRSTDRCPTQSQRPPDEGGVVSNDAIDAKVEQRVCRF
jgi:hypothetical protein